MEFLNNVTLVDVVNREVAVFVRDGGNTIYSLSKCRAYFEDGLLWVDCVPELNRKFKFAVPRDATISTHESSYASGRFGVYVSVSSDAGKYVVKLLAVRQELLVQEVLQQ